MWSIEIKQPDINIVRNYTPLPLYVAGTDPITKEPHLRLVSESEEQGKFIIIVKKYKQGEFSRWITGLNLLHQVEIRGPIVEYKFPGHPLDKFYIKRPQLANLLSKIKPDPEYPEKLPKPENYVYYGAGTGILPLLQLIYSPNPPKGFIEAYLSIHSESNLLDQFKTLNYFAEKIGRVKFHYFIGEKGEHLGSKDILKPTLPNFTGLSDIKLSEEQYREKLLAEKRVEVKRQIANGGISNEDKKPIQGEEDHTIPKLDVSKFKPDNAFQQFNIFKKRKTTHDPSFAFVCGPEGYMANVSGKSDLNNLDMVDNGPIGGKLREKGWTLKNIKRLQ
ncbi:unnamed protein product [Ambrosiozyma monospora]|uniref:Unnamed protein product n=1 Tax=Ambrosiozyma monospora TaxID=43982 RepID=A0ACB5T753_AMBMO|nr:unnamed protein product [Ambrosiozyma monospora]